MVSYNVDVYVVTPYCANIHMEYRYNKMFPFKSRGNPLKRINQDINLLLNVYC